MELALLQDIQMLYMPNRNQVSRLWSAMYVKMFFNIRRTWLIARVSAALVDCQ